MTHEQLVEEMMFKEGIFYEDENSCVHVKDVPSTILLTVRDLITTTAQRVREDVMKEFELK